MNLRTAGREFLLVGLISVASALSQSFVRAGASSAQPADTVQARVIPALPFLEADPVGQYVNCDFRFENRTGEKIRLTGIELRTFDRADRMSSRRFLSEQGSMSPGLETLPRREIDRDRVMDIFNPFHTLDPAVPVASMRFDFQFQGTRGYTATATFRPVEYRTKTKLVPPLRGRFLVYDGHDYYSHHRRIDLSSPVLRRLGLTSNPVRYAYDFSSIDEAGSWHRGDREKPGNWLAYGAPVYAPAAGVIVSVANDVPDNRIENGTLIYPRPGRNGAAALLGNHVVIDHGTGEYSMLAHMKSESVAVRLNDHVRRDQLLGRIGFSGDTGLHVHLHYHLADGHDPRASSALPVYFTEYRRLLGAQVRQVQSGLIHTGDLIER